MKECPSCRGCFPDDVIHCPEDGTATTISIAGEPILDGRYQLERRLGQGIVHRDLKPLNVMVCEGLPTSEGVKILGFGLAKIKSGELLGSFIAAQTTGLMGSPFYMAPEQWSDEPPDARADVYSLGVMLFQMLCGEVPFKGSSIPAIMKKHLTSDVPSLASKGIDVPPHIESVLRHALEKEPAHRTASADEFARELREAMSSASAELKRTGDRAPIDPGKTIVTPAPANVTSPPPGSTTAFDPLAGTISAAALQEEEHKTLFAQRELAREAAQRQKLADEEARRLRAEEQKRQHEEAARDKERKHLEEIVAAQTKVLEDKLTQLASTMSPKTGGVDAEATHIQRAGMITGGDSLAGSASQAFPRVDVALTPKKRSTAMPIAAVVLVVLLAGGAVGGYFFYKSRSVAIAGPVKPTTPVDPPIKPDLVEIEGGTFQMGRNDSEATEGPAHPVTVNTFSMDKTEVTNAEYAQFVKQTNHTPP